MEINEHLAKIESHITAIEERVANIERAINRENTIEENASIHDRLHKMERLLKISLWWVKKTK